MDIEEISNNSVRKRLEWGESNALEDSGRQSRIVVLAGCASPCCAEYYDYISKKKSMTLAPYSRGWNEQDASDTNSQQMISGKKSDFGEFHAVEQRQVESISSKERREGGCYDGEQGNNEKDEISPP